jgi:ech hydrogenase subunit D
MHLEFKDIEKADLLNICRAMKNDGQRLATITALSDLTLLYSFVKDEKQIVLRYSADCPDPVQSISEIYSYAFMYENEINDLFGIKVANMNVDFGGHFYETTVKMPFRAAKSEKAEKEEGKVENE